VLTKMEVYNPIADAPQLPLGGFGPNNDPIQVLNIDGLGPVKASITTTPLATRRGELYQGGTTGVRNIVLTLGLNPDFVEYPSMATLRQILYRYLMPEQKTKLRFYSDEIPPVEIEGYVESFDPNIFSEDPQVVISIICPDPDFVSEATILTGTVTELLEGPEFEYIGSIPTGFELKVESSDAKPSFNGQLMVGLSQPGLSDQYFFVDPVLIDASQYFSMSTAKPKRVRTLSTDGFGTPPTNLMPNIVGVWPLIQPGQNTINVTTAAEDVGQNWTLAFFSRFGGL
jgi:hypothetical protein